LGYAENGEFRRLRHMDSSELDRLAAAAGRLHVGVVELEAVPHHRGDEVELGAVEVNEALRVDEEPHTLLLEHLVVGARLAVRPLEEVRESGAAAAADPDAQRRAQLAALVGLLADLRDRFVRNADHLTGPPSSSCSRRSPP